jgi:hypothetical protein
MLSQYGPALLIQCKNQIEFGQQLVESWLKSFMFNKKIGMMQKELPNIYPIMETLKPIQNILILMPQRTLD